MSELQTASAAVWAAVKAKVEAAMAVGQPLSTVGEFVPYRRGRVGKLQTYAVVVLERTVVPSEWGANRGLAEQTIEFGITGTTYQPGQMAEALQKLAFALADLFLEDPTLGGLARDLKVDAIAPDARPEGNEDSTQPWAVVRLTWDYEFLRP